jgi:predicted O-methyltransferase YrrM
LSANDPGLSLLAAFLLGACALAAGAGPALRDTDLPDEKAARFLDRHRGQWHDYNVPEVDGRTLHDLILKNGFTRALEIGTSTGHSTIWIARALAKTGGRVITIEIDEGRYRTARLNFEEAGLSDYIDARLADAHELVPQLAGPFDFVFSDADKEWYTQYLKDVLPKLAPGGCFVAHNTSMQMRGIGEFLDYVSSLPELDTTLDTQSSSGMSISCRTAAAKAAVQSSP